MYTLKTRAKTTLNILKTVDEGFKNNKKRKEKILEHNIFILWPESSYRP